MLSYIPIVLLNLYFANLALANTHSFNCTLPPDDSHYVAGVKVRSTLSIFWSAVYTVFVCTWAVQHLNIPPPEQRTLEFDWRHFWKIRIPASLWTRLKWMLLTILMPEYLLGRALSDLLDAYKFRKFTKSQAKLRHKWTITHGYYANMGGFMFSLPPTPNPNPEHNGNENEVSDTTGEPHSPPGTSTHYTRNDYSAEEKGEHSSGSKHKTPLTGPIAINAKQLRFLLEEQILDTEPPISQNEILDKGQGDGFATISAVVQLIWLVSQLITRKVRHVPSSQLEILALAFAVYTIFTYILYYPKPQNIQVASNISYFECTCTHCKQKENEKKRREEPDHDRNGCDICKGKDYNSENCKKGVKNQDDGLCAKYSRLRANLEEDVSQSFFLNNFFPNDDPMELKLSYETIR